jgi:hypothetical protein
VTAVDFSSDGKQILSAGRDRQAILWNSIDVDPAILINQSVLRYSPGARPIELLNDVKIKHPTQKRLGGYRMVFSGGGAEGISGEMLGLDTSLASGFGWEMVADKILQEGRVIATWSDATVAPDEGSSAAPLRYGFEILMAPDVTPSEVERVLSLVTYRCDTAVSSAESDDLPVREVRVDLVPAGDDAAVATQVITVQLVGGDAEQG